MSTENSFADELAENFKLKLNLSIRNQLINNLSKYIEIINGKATANEIKLKIVEESDALMSILIGLATGKKIRTNKNQKEPTLVFNFHQLRNTIDILMRNQGFLNSNFTDSLDEFKKKLINDNDNLVKCLLELKFDKSELFEIDYELIESENIDLSTADILRSELKQGLIVLKNDFDKNVQDLKIGLDKYCLNLKTELSKQLNAMKTDLETKFIAMKTIAPEERSPLSSIIKPSTISPSISQSTLSTAQSNIPKKINDTIFSFNLDRSFFDKSGSLKSPSFYSKNNTIWCIDAVFVKNYPNISDHLKLCLKCEDRKGYEIKFKFCLAILNKFDKPNKQFNYSPRIYSANCPYVCLISADVLLNPDSGFMKDDKINVMIALDIECE